MVKENNGYKELDEFESLFDQFKTSNPDWCDYLTDSTYYDLMSWFDDKKGYYDLDGYSDEAHMFADYVWYNYIVVPKFKIGDNIIPKRPSNKSMTITKVENGYYYSGNSEICPIEEQDCWEICTDELVSIDKVADYLKTLTYQEYPGGQMLRMIGDNEIEKLRKYFK